MSAPVAIKIVGPADLIALVPYLIGFKPESSLVMIALQGGKVGCTARVDLAEASEQLGCVIQAFQGADVTSVVPVVFSEACAPEMHMALPHSGLIVEVTAAFTGAGIEVPDAMLVCQGRRWSYLCENEDCCPREGTPVEDPTTSSAVASATFAGIAPMSSREEYVGRLAPLPDREERRAALLEELARQTQLSLDHGQVHLRNVLVRRICKLARSETWAPEDVVFAAVGLQLITVRDAVWMAIEADRVPLAGEFWRHVARSVPAPYSTAPLFLFAWSRWRAGDGALAAEAIGLCKDSSPSYSAADLLYVAVIQGIGPDRLPRLRRPRA